MPQITRTIKVATTGSSGSATGTGATSIPKGAKLTKLYFDYNASTPATTDVTITALGDPADEVIHTRSNSTTDAWVYPSIAPQNSSGGAVTNGATEPVIHSGIMSVGLAQADALTDALILYAFFEV